MVTFLYIILYLFIILLAILLLILFVPIIYTLKGFRYASSDFVIKISWLAHLLYVMVNIKENKEFKVYLRLLGFNINLKDKKRGLSKKSKKTNQATKKPKSKKNKADYLHVFNRNFFSQLGLFIKKIYYHILPRECHMHLYYGLDDPADTGMLSAVITSCVSPYLHQADVAFYPVFDQELLQGQVSIKGRIIMAVIIYYCLQFYFAPGVRKTIHIMRKK